MRLLTLLLVGGLSIATANAEQSATKPSDIWNQLDIVPMPKEIKLTGSVFTPTPDQFVLVIGDTPLRQSELGAEWFNKRLVSMGGKPLAIQKQSQPTDPSFKRIVIGSPEDNPLIAKAVEAGTVSVGKNNPGVRGYEIRQADDGSIYLAGADPIGVLYACVTLGELLEKSDNAPPLLRVANVRDWPDIQYLYVLGSEPPSDIVKEPNSPAARESYLSKMSSMYDTMLRRKLSMVWFKPLAWGDKAFREMTPYAKETVRMGIETGKELGIESLYYHLYPFVGLREDHPNVAAEMLEQKPKSRYNTWLQSWSLDDERREYAKELAGWIKDVGFTDVGFHDTDTGGYLNPANWNNRGPFDRQRWGNDYAAATINKFKIFYDELIKENPALRVNLTLYPYNSEIFDPSETVKADLQKTLNINREALDTFRKRYETYWTQLNAAFPKDDVAFAIREPWSADGAPGLRAFLNLIDGRPLFAWYGLAAAEFYCNVPSWLGTLHSSSPNDIVFTQNIYVDKGYVPILSYAMREYSWNTEAPGSATFQTRDRARTFASAAGDNTTESYTVVLPHLVRNYFGRELAPEITRAIQQNVSPFIVAGGRPDRNIIDETEERMKMELDRAQVAVEAMDGAWQKLQGTQNALKLDPEVLARVAYLRQVFYATKTTAGVKEAVYRSQRLSSVNRFDEAEAAIAEGRSILESGEAHLRDLEKEGPSAVSGQLNSARMTLDKTIPMLQSLLDQRSETIKTSRGSGGIPVQVLKTLAAEESLSITKVKDAPVIDGKVTEPMWLEAYPAEAWFLTGPGHLVADAETRFLTLADQDYLYVAFQCQTTSKEVGLSDADREFVRIYLKRSGASQSDLLAFAVWANGKVESTDKSLIPTLKCQVTNDGTMWQGELRIPLTALGTSTDREKSRIGFLRSYNRFGVANVSANVPLESSIAGPFEDAREQLKKLPSIKWEEKPFHATTRIRVTEPKVREVVLDDRIATMVDFGLVADADRVLDHVVVEVETVNAEGQVESRKEVLAEPSMKYNLKPANRFSATFLQAVNKGSIRLILKSDQAKAETTYRFEKDISSAELKTTDP
jgi:hypothetical protein